MQNINHLVYNIIFLIPILIIINNYLYFIIPISIYNFSEEPKNSCTLQLQWSPTVGVALIRIVTRPIRIPSSKVHAVQAELLGFIV